MKNIKEASRDELIEEIERLKKEIQRLKAKCCIDNSSVVMLSCDCGSGYGCFDHDSAFECTDCHYGPICENCVTFEGFSNFSDEGCVSCKKHTDLLCDTCKNKYKMIDDVTCTYCGKSESESE